MATRGRRRNLERAQERFGKRGRGSLPPRRRAPSGGPSGRHRSASWRGRRRRCGRRRGRGCRRTPAPERAPPPWPPPRAPTPFPETRSSQFQVSQGRTSKIHSKALLAFFDSATGFVPILHPALFYIITSIANAHSPGQTGGFE